MTLLRAPWTDLAAAFVLAVAGVVWVLASRHVGVAKGAFPLGLPPEPDLTAKFGGTEPPAASHDVGTAVLVNIVVAVPIAVRRRFPYAAFVLALGGLFALRNGLAWPGFLAILIVAYSAVAYGRYVAGAFGLLLVAAALAAAEFTQSIPPVPGWLGPFVILLPVGLAAATIRSTRARADAAARRALSLERERDASTRAAIAEERARIARELHDVVSHHVSVMVIQAGAAGKVIDSRPDLAAGALRAIESSGREAMGELRHLLGLVAPLDDQLHPQPGLDDLDALISTVRAAGQPVTLRYDTPRYGTGALPQGVDLAAYRVVQEGLTNALRYAPGAPTAVSLSLSRSREGDALVIEVRNDPPDVATPTGGAGGGAGLVGLAERLRLYHGTLDTGRRIGGGFCLTARIPLDRISSTVAPA